MLYCAQRPLRSLKNEEGSTSMPAESKVAVWRYKTFVGGGGCFFDHVPWCTGAIYCDKNATICLCPISKNITLYM